MTADCSQCKNRYSEDCKGKPYYEPREIKFCSLQITWLLSNLGTLHEFIWPGGADVDIPRRKKPGGGGYFETPADFSMEVERRLEHIGLDGLMLYLHYAYEWDELQLGKYFRLSVSEVRFRLEAVVWYCSGWNFDQRFPYRRWHCYRNYESWKSQERGGDA